MSDVPAKSNPNAAGYKSTFVHAREAFRAGASRILLTFSPALRYDLPEAALHQFWPGDGNVDVVGGTRYTGGADQQKQSTANMRAYFQHCSAVGKALVLSKMGGCSSAKKDDDKFLQIMLHELEGLQMAGISFKYVTIFLADKWGADAALSFLRPPRT